MKNEFSSTELANISTEADSIVSSHLSRLDSVSNDIKVLESKLQKAAIPFVFIYALFSKKYYVTTREYATGYEEDIYTDLFSYEDHCLVWMQTDKGARLLYNIYITEKEFNRDNGKEIESSPTHTFLKSSKPLIETKALFRLNIEKELPCFYKKLIEKLETKNKEDFYLLESSTYTKNSDKEIFSPVIAFNLNVLGINLPIDVSNPF